MISRAKLNKIKKTLHEDHHDIIDTWTVMHTLVDHGLECLDKIDGGAEQRDWAAERARMDKQVRLALLDVGEELTGEPNVAKALYQIDCIGQMLRAKLAWAREWAYYQPRISEEFS